MTIGLTPLLVHEMSPCLSWRSIFMLFGLVGLIWAAAWYWWFRDEPSQHAGVSKAELAYITADRKVPAVEDRPRGVQASGTAFWWRLLTHRNVLALCLMYLPNSFIFYFCITWFHRYLAERWGMEGRELAFFTGLPLLVSVAADVLGGITTDWAVRHFGTRWGRTGVGFGSYVVAGSCVLAAALVHDGRLAGALFALGTAANIFPLGSAWGTCQDIGGRHAGVVSATMNTAGQIGTIACPLLVIYLKNRFGWNIDPMVIGTSFLLVSLCWLFIDPRRKVFD